MPASPALWIEVTDASTGAAIGEGVTGVAVVGGEPIQLEWAHAGEDNVLVAYGPKGAYDIFLAKDGYLAWFKGGVAVTGSRCLLTTTDVEAEMVPVEGTLSNGPLQPPPAPGE
jgi:hypothetical protein